jgi:hypothetical protein
LGTAPADAHVESSQAQADGITEKTGDYTPNNESGAKMLDYDAKRTHQHANGFENGTDACDEAASFLESQSEGFGMGQFPRREANTGKQSQQRHR